MGLTPKPPKAFPVERFMLFGGTGGGRVLGGAVRWLGRWEKKNLGTINKQPCLLFSNYPFVYLVFGV